MAKFRFPQEATDWFVNQLAMRKKTIVRREKWKVYAGKGRWAYPEVLFTDTNEAFFFKFWRNAFIPDSSDDIRMEYIRDLDERIKFTIRVFGNENRATTFLNESTIIRLMELGDSGVAAYFVVAFENGDVSSCRIADFYDFAIRHGTYSTFSNLKQDMNNDLPYYVPLGWLKAFGAIITGFPEIAQ